MVQALPKLTQADILIKEFAKRNQTLAKIDALNMVAVLHGHSNWMQLSASETSYDGPIPFSKSYDIGDISQLSVEGIVSNELLAMNLKHVAPNSCTVLCSYTDDNDEAFQLQLYGCVLIELTDWAGNISVLSSATSTLEEYKALEILKSSSKLLYSAYSDVSVIHQPFFEWVNGQGEPVGELFEGIHANKCEELLRLNQLVD